MGTSLYEQYIRETGGGQTATQTPAGPPSDLYAQYLAQQAPASGTGLPRHGAARTALDNAANAVIWGLGTKLSAAASSLAHHGNLDYYRFYADALQRQRAENAQAHPGAAVAGTVAGAVASPLNRLLPVGGVGVPAMAARGAAGGAIAGGVTGAAEAPQGKELQGAVLGTAGGALFGSTLPVLGQYAPRLTGAVVGAGLGAAANPDNRTAGAVGGAAAGAAGVHLLRQALAARAGGQVASANPIVPPSDATAIPATAARTERTLVRWLDRGGVTPQSAAADLAMRPVDQPVTIMELGGEPVQRLARAARGVSPGAGKSITDALVERARSGFQRTLGVLEKHLGVERGSFLDAADDIATRRNEMANPLYEQAYTAPPIPAERFGKLLERPSVKQALSFAQKIAAETGGEAPAINADGSVPVKTVDLIKKSLDDVLGFAKTRGTLPDGTAATKETLRAINETRRQLLSVADEAVPAYAQARQVYAGQSALANALETGRAEFLSSSPGEAARAVKGLSQGEREMYLKGALEAVAEKLGPKARASDFVKAIRDNNEFEPRFRALLPEDKAFGAFLKELEQEGQFSETLRVVTGGSNTADKLADQEMFGNDAAKAIQDVASSGIKAVVARRLAALGNRMLVQRAAQADALASYLTAGTRNRAELDQVLARLVEARRAAERQAARSAQASTASGTITGSLFRPAQ